MSGPNQAIIQPTYWDQVNSLNNFNLSQGNSGKTYSIFLVVPSISQSLCRTAMLTVLLAILLGSSDMCASHPCLPSAQSGWSLPNQTEVLNPNPVWISAVYLLWPPCVTLLLIKWQLLSTMTGSKRRHVVHHKTIARVSTGWWINLKESKFVFYTTELNRTILVCTAQHLQFVSP